MTIKIIREKLANSTGPVAMALDKSDHFKVLVIGFNKGMILKKHKANGKTKLTVLEGEVVYYENEKETILRQYDEYNIPIGIYHHVEARTDSLCLLTQERN